MQGLEDLINLGHEEYNAKLILESINKHTGELHGCNEIVDIIYTSKYEKDITLKCTLCGEISHKVFRNGRNKWSELKTTCTCQKPQKFPKIEKRHIVRNDDPSFIGMLFGDQEVTGIGYKKHKNKSGSTVVWDTKCVRCGRERKNRMPSIVKKGSTCACHTEIDIDLWESRKGERYGKLVIDDFEPRTTGKCKIMYALCTCDCGGKKITQYSSLVFGQTKSCGCLEIEKRNGRIEPRTHSPLYATWQGMRSRCNSPNSPAYKDYGGRGIKVCDEWNDLTTGFDAFEKWAFDNGYIPESGLSLDRIDVNGNYEPSNCRYTTVYVQTVNQRKHQTPHGRQAQLYTVDGEEKTKAEWCKEYSISTVAVDYRIKTLGMSFEEAIKTPKSRVGNKFAGEQARARVKDVNKCESYIEVNLLFALFRNGEGLHILPQENICGYRVDFRIDKTNILIECDGYDSHKTKEQIMHDCQRDRVLQREGYVVLRFTGSEINKDPDKCAIEIVETVRTLCGDINESWKANAG